MLDSKESEHKVGDSVWVSHNNGMFSKLMIKEVNDSIKYIPSSFLVDLSGNENHLTTVSEEKEKKYTSECGLDFFESDVVWNEGC